MDGLGFPNSSLPNENCSEEPPPPDSLLELKWPDFQGTLSSAFSHLRHTEDLVDVTLVSGGQRASAHKLVLCAASPWFKTLLMDNPCKHPVIILNEEYQQYLPSILDFIYSGCVRIPHHDLSQFLQLSEYLQIKGLADSYDLENTRFSSSPTRKKHKLPPDLSDQSSSSGAVKKSCSEVPDLNPPNPDPQHPYLLLEPKLEILDEPVEYSHYGDPDHMGPSYDGSYSNLPGDVPCYNSRQSSSHYTRNQQNSLQDLMNITGRLDEVDSHRNVQRLSKPRIEPSPINCNSNSTGFPDGRGAHYGVPASYFKSGIPQETSVVPYLPPQNDPSSGPPAPPPPHPHLHSLDSRFCHLCGKHYSNSSNLRQHIRLIHTSGSLLCPLCRKSFRNKLYLRRHVISFHEHA